MQNNDSDKTCRYDLELLLYQTSSALQGEIIRLGLEITMKMGSVESRWKIKKTCFAWVLVSKM
jgi:hypothetical protein